MKGGTTSDNHLVVLAAIVGEVGPRHGTAALLAIPRNVVSSAVDGLRMMGSRRGRAPMAVEAQLDLSVQQIVCRPRQDGAPVGPCLVFRSDNHQISVTDAPPAVEVERNSSKLVSVGRNTTNTTRIVTCDGCLQFFARDVAFRCPCNLTYYCGKDW